jgi:hypothetical protein
VHGADAPAPVSHGAVRIPQWVAEYFPTLVNSDDRDGDYVYVWGMDGKEPEEYTRDESLPIFNYANPNSTLVTTTHLTALLWPHIGHGRPWSAYDKNRGRRVRSWRATSAAT